MTQQDAVFTASIADLYERTMVPIFFAPYARIVAEAVRELAPRRILETAAGTGALTRALVAALPEAEVTATDLNAAMIDYATAHERDARVHWSVADAQALPFAAQTFDTVVCQFGVMFFPDQEQGYREARRVLTDGGTFAFTVWDSVDHNDFARAVHDAVAAEFPENPPLCIARTPHGHGDVDAHERRLRAVGFREVTSRCIDLRSRASSAHALATALCQGTPLRNELLARDPGHLDARTDAVERAVAARFGDGAIEGAMRAYLITAR